MNTYYDRITTALRTIADKVDPDGAATAVNDAYYDDVPESLERIADNFSGGGGGGGGGLRVVKGTLHCEASGSKPATLFGAIIGDERFDPILAGKICAMELPLSDLSDPLTLDFPVAEEGATLENLSLYEKSDFKLTGGITAYEHPVVEGGGGDYVEDNILVGFFITDDFTLTLDVQSDDV